MSGFEIRQLDTRRSTVEEIAAELRPPIFLRYANEAAQVSRIVADVAARGDAAVTEYARRFDWPDADPARFEVSAEEVNAAEAQIPDGLREALHRACEAVLRFHAEAIPKSWALRREDRDLGQRWTPLRRVGIYVPGGTPLPSTVYMCAAPARAAGVDEIVMVTPSDSEGRLTPLMLAAAKVSGVDRVFRVGGPHAIAALAFGTATIPRVDKIVGPGNIYVTLAKREVFGQVGIESLPGPSDVLVISDGSVPASWVAADLLSQAEHGALSSAVLCTPCEKHRADVWAELARQVVELERAEEALASLRDRGALILCKSLEECVEMANAIAPEHLEVLVKGNPQPLVDGLRCAGAIFVGAYTPEPVGDYVAGPSHVLPTEGTARYASPLGVEDFMRRSSLLRYSETALRSDADDIMTLAEAEGLTAHARSVRLRLRHAPDRGGRDQPPATTSSAP